ncbi:unnamed protein product [Nesidiocoris tenuis]|uniref:Uncharacterized protein n=1 Tax=Nesidiocoris tenuis TaxID=355587 RepID=A0A6H5HTY0_9HEMI|nr:unnamed protein product [Nesidiocoris tenuis]CAB0020435.1 unnamed protein product [Nesidiocoris tenuis]
MNRFEASLEKFLFYLEGLMDFLLPKLENSCPNGSRRDDAHINVRRVSVGTRRDVSATSNEHITTNARLFISAQGSSC